MKLYEIAEKYSNFNHYMEQMLDNEDLTLEDYGMLKDTLEGIKDGLENKAENIVKLIKYREGEIESCKKEKERINTLQKRLEKQNENLKEYLFTILTNHKIDKVSAGTFKVSRAKSVPSVNIVDESKIPDSYKVTQPSTIDKKKVLSDLKVIDKIMEDETVIDKEERLKELKLELFEGALLVKDKYHLKIT